MILPSADMFSVILAFAAAIAYAVLAFAGARAGQSIARSIALFAWLVHGMALGWALFGGPSRFGFAPAISVTVWLAVLVYAVESYLLPQLPIRWKLGWLAAGAVLLALAFPGNLLASSASIWLPLHWALGIAAYGLFGVAVAHGWFMTRAEKRFRLAGEPQSGIPLLLLERLTFRFVMAGFVLLSATLVVVMLFGKQIYGAHTVWRWDHKTVFSVLSWLTFAVLLLGRAWFGWRGRVAVRVLYAGAALLLLAYVGSRFVMEVVLGRTP